MSAFNNKDRFNTTIHLLRSLNSNFVGNVNQSRAVLDTVEHILTAPTLSNFYQHVNVVLTQVYSFLLPFTDPYYFAATWMSNNDNEEFNNIYNKLNDLFFKLGLPIPPGNDRELNATRDSADLIAMINRFTTGPCPFNEQMKIHIDELTRHGALNFDQLPPLREINAKLIHLLPATESALGHGKYGAVIKVNLRGVPVAVKSLVDGVVADSTEQLKVDVKKEALLLQIYDIPGVIRFFGVDNKIEPTKMYLECGVGTLRDVVREGKFINPFPLPMKIAYLAGLCDTFALLHSYGIVHRDIKSSNILLMADGSLKISDFGLTRSKLFSHSAGVTPKGTHSYMAPELLMYSEVYVYGEQTDMYAFAILMNEVLTETAPFFINVQQLVGQMYSSKGHIRPVIYEESEIIKEEIKRRWHTDVNVRGSFAELSVFLKAYK